MTDCTLRSSPLLHYSPNSPISIHRKSADSKESALFYAFPAAAICASKGYPIRHSQRYTQCPCASAFIALPFALPPITPSSPICDRKGWTSARLQPVQIYTRCPFARLPHRASGRIRQTALIIHQRAVHIQENNSMSHFSSSDIAKVEETLASAALPADTADLPRKSEVSKHNYAVWYAEHKTMCLKFAFPPQNIDTAPSTL